jgi:hypothetical protein
MDVHVYADLSEMGFRRSGDHLYRPHCQNCNACVPARIPWTVHPNRQQKRIFKRNADLQVRPAKPASAKSISTFTSAISNSATPMATCIRRAATSSRPFWYATCLLALL